METIIGGRIVVADPKQLGEREASDGGVSRELNDTLAADAGVDPIDLRLTALVAPDQAGADYCASGIEHDEAVHLTGETDALNRSAIDLGFAENTTYGSLRSTPPVVGILFGPKGFLHVHRGVRLCAASGDIAVFIKEQRTSAAGTYVYPKPIHIV